jgi:hypothetical protein
MIKALSTLSEVQVAHPPSGWACGCSRVPSSLPASPSHANAGAGALGRRWNQVLSRSPRFSLTSWRRVARPPSSRRRPRWVVGRVRQVQGIVVLQKNRGAWSGVICQRAARRDSGMRVRVGQPRPAPYVPARHYPASATPGPLIMCSSTGIRSTSSDSSFWPVKRQWSGNSIAKRLTWRWSPCCW